MGTAVTGYMVVNRIADALTKTDPLRNSAIIVVNMMVVVFVRDYTIHRNIVKVKPIKIQSRQVYEF